MADASEAKTENMASIFEPFARKPFDIFFIKAAGRRFVGRKQPAVVSRSEGIETMKCCLISAEMVLGVAEREQVTESGVTVFYRPLDERAKHSLLKLVGEDPLTDLYYPYCSLLNSPEDSSEDPYWVPTAERVEELDRGESMLREYTLQWLNRFDMTNKVVYDPACSTGTFLHSIKQAFPQTHTVGQDLSREMVDYSRSKVDELYWGDSISAPINEETADFVFFRFLNVCVVNAKQAHELFLANAKCCRIGGYIVLFGHTPVIPGCEWFEELGFVVEQRTGFVDALNSVFQYYVLRKVRPLPVYVIDSEPE